jgi:hypothetical protein
MLYLEPDMGKFVCQPSSCASRTTPAATSSTPAAPPTCICSPAGPQGRRRRRPPGAALLLRSNSGSVRRCGKPTRRVCRCAAPTSGPPRATGRRSGSSPCRTVCGTASRLLPKGWMTTLHHGSEGHRRPRTPATPPAGGPTRWPTAALVEPVAAGRHLLGAAATTVNGCMSFPSADLVVVRLGFSPALEADQLRTVELVKDLISATS